MCAIYDLADTNWRVERASFVILLGIGMMQSSLLRRHGWNGMGIGVGKDELREASVFVSIKS